MLKFFRKTGSKKIFNEIHKMDKIVISEKHNYLTNIPKNKLFIIICQDANKRQLLHQYIEYTYPFLKKTSLHTKNFWAEIKVLIKKKCFFCNHKKISLNNYHFGCLESNNK